MEQRRGDEQSRMGIDVPCNALTTNLHVVFRNPRPIFELCIGRRGMSFWPARSNAGPPIP